MHNANVYPIKKGREKVQLQGKHLEIESAKIVSRDYQGLDIEALYLTSFLFIAIHSKQL